MNKHLVITVVGPDRPGLVEQLAQTLAEHQANWLESRMADLAGRFAGMVEASVAEEKVAALSEALERLQAEGLKITVDAELPQHKAVAGRNVHLELTGQDRVGIVHEISSVLARHDISIERLHTATESASMSGEDLFHAWADLRVPGDTDMEQLQGGLEVLADELMVDINLEDQQKG